MVTPAAEAVLDAAALERLRRVGGETLVARMIDLFLAGSTLRMQAARAGSEEGDLPAVERAVHSLKSSAGNLGAARLQRLAGEVELLASAGEGPGVAALLPELGRAFDAARDALLLLRGATAS